MKPPHDRRSSHDIEPEHSEREYAVRHGNINVVIPTLNPDDGILRLVDEIKKTVGCPIIVVNDGSRENRSWIFERLKNSGVTVLHHAVNLGKGRALKTAFNHFLLNNPNDIGVITCDGDGQHTPDDIGRCVDALAERPRSMILGCRDFSVGNVPFKSYFGNRLTSSVMKLCGLTISDTQTGLRGIPRKLMEALMNINGERFEFETEMLLASRRHNVGIFEVPIETVYVDGNRETHFDPIVDSLKIYRVIGRYFLKKIAAFASSGILSALIDVSLFYLLFNHVLAGAAYGRLFWSVSLSRAVSLCVNYLLNRNLVFGRARGNKVFDVVSFLKYLALCVVVMSLSYLMTKVGNLMFPEQNIVLIKVIADVIAFFVSFGAQQTIVFKNNKGDDK